MNHLNPPGIIRTCFPFLFFFFERTYISSLGSSSYLVCSGCDHLSTTFLFLIPSRISSSFVIIGYSSFSTSSFTTRVYPSWGKKVGSQKISLSNCFYVFFYHSSQLFFFFQAFFGGAYLSTLTSFTTQREGQSSSFSCEEISEGF